ncbi:hypothetical protein PIB30_031084 [Stylosanthes scabra]|uniref:RPW8 domain-containing protein n=1 Tax=Stylosanthes scabra TaxID=79078 RepID=A0ABU6TDK7_9FABA|nr:hypothetical protein [Stylosanthes scabra]
MASHELGGDIVGVAFGALLQAVMEMKEKAVMFKSTLSYLQTTLMAIDPLIKEMEHDNINYLLDRPREELRLLFAQIAEVTDLVDKCSRIHKLNYIARIRCQEQLLAMVDILVKRGANRDVVFCACDAFTRCIFSPESPSASTFAGEALGVFTPPRGWRLPGWRLLVSSYKTGAAL